MFGWINYTNQHPKWRQIKEKALKTGIFEIIPPKNTPNTTKKSIPMPPKSPKNKFIPQKSF